MAPEERNPVSQEDLWAGEFVRFPPGQVGSGITEWRPGRERKYSCMVFANLHRVNTPILSDFKPPNI